MSKDMRSGNRPNFNTGNTLTPNGGGASGVRPGSAPVGRAAELAGASSPALRRFFAPGTPAAAVPGGSEVCRPTSTSSPRPSGARGCAAGVVAVEVAPAASVETEASSRPGTAAAVPDVEPDAQPARGHRRVNRRVDVSADVARANPFTPPLGGPFRGWR